MILYSHSCLMIIFYPVRPLSHSVLKWVDLCSTWLFKGRQEDHSWWTPWPQSPEFSRPSSPVEEDQGGMFRWDYTSWSPISWAGYITQEGWGDVAWTFRSGRDGFRDLWVVRHVCVHGSRWDGCRGADVIVRQLSIIPETLWGLERFSMTSGRGSHIYL